MKNHFAHLKRREGLVFFVGLVLFLLWFAWVFLPPSQAYVPVHDYLDSIFSYYKARAHLKYFFFNYSIRVQQLANLPLNALGLSDFGLGQNLYLFFSPFDAYVINEFLIRLIAFVGMFLWLKSYILMKDKRSYFIAVVMSIAFAIIGHKAQRLSTVAYLPLLAFAVTNIWRNQKSWHNWVIALFYPFYSFFYYGGFVVCGWFVLLSLYAYFKKLGPKGPSFLTNNISPARETRATATEGEMTLSPLESPSSLTRAQAPEISFFKS